MPAVGDSAGLHAGTAAGFGHSCRCSDGALVTVRSALHEMAPSNAGGELERLRESFIPPRPAIPLDADGFD